MGLQWYRWDPEKNRMAWQEAEERPGPDWESSDVPLFDSALAATWTVQEEAPVYLTEEDYPEFRLDRAVRRDLPVAKGLFQALPPDGLKWEEWKSTVRDEAQRQYRERMHAQAVETTRREHPSDLDQIRRWETVYPVSMMRPPREVLNRWAETMRPRPGSNPQVRAWWQHVHRRSSASPTPTGLPRRSGLRLAGHRPLTSGKRR